MFARFTTSARQVVVLAQQQARELGAAHVGTEHLLLGLLAEGEGVAAVTLSEAGIHLDDARAVAQRITGCAASRDEDAAALEAIGIDLDAVRAKVEEAFGPGALERARDRRGRRFRKPRLAGHIPFSPRAKKVLELALREALQLRDNSIGSEHILLGLLREGRGVGMLTLTALGVADAELRARVLAAVGKAA